MERRFDEAFGITRTKLDRNQLLSQRDISEAFWVEDEIRMERDNYERLLREHGIDPWGLPGGG